MQDIYGHNVELIDSSSGSCCATRTEHSKRFINKVRLTNIQLISPRCEILLHIFLLGFILCTMTGITVKSKTPELIPRKLRIVFLGSIICRKNILKVYQNSITTRGPNFTSNKRPQRSQNVQAKLQHTFWY